MLTKAETFTAKCEGSIYNFSHYLGIDGDIDSLPDSNPKVTVKYVLEPEVREYGIKNVDITIRGVIVSIEWEVSEEDITPEVKEILLAKGGRELRNGNIAGTVEVDTTHLSEFSTWEQIETLEFNKDGGFSIDNVDFDFKRKNIHIYNI